MYMYLCEAMWRKTVGRIGTETLKMTMRQDKTEEALTNVKNALLELEATGSTGFEGFLQTILSELTGNTLVFEALMDDQPVRYLVTAGAGGVSTGIEHGRQTAIVQFLG